ncbi:hypothetical protein [Micromonospora inyonensis]|uniref:Uncharacterized protein n=1 Tax=Micromonospora inyonensis TaxID=47866 RepID=A0A1C6RKU1_9ACTN|nr:hypothetical protein [Micromonospora inyonensis]SCL17779.1 hypothetical protein GA0074694_2126 [Micromonospora inyonensis]
MDNNPEQTTAPTALDKVAAALAELGQGTAAAIAARAGVGYSTATKRLRLLEEARQAETFRADDGRTLWRQAAKAGTSDHDDAPATTTNADGDGGDDGELPSRPARTEDGADEPEQPDEPPAPPQKTGAAGAAEPDDEPTSVQPASADPPRPGGSPSGPTASEAEGESEAVLATADAEDPAVAEAADASEDPPSPEPATTDASTATTGQAEAANPSTGGRSRRSKGTLRGAILDVFEAHPDQQFKTSQLCKAIDKANEGSGSAKASAGAVVNAVHKLVADSHVVQVVEKPATFQLAPKSD